LFNLLVFSIPDFALQAKLIKLNNIIIDAKSGVTGAGLYLFEITKLFSIYSWTINDLVSNISIFVGRGAKEANLYTEIAEGIHAYGVTSHRHGNSYPKLTSWFFQWKFIKLATEYLHLPF
jgi:N-acetyl-gamma-glutamylphosphate reductase